MGRLVVWFVLVCAVGVMVGVQTAAAAAAPATPRTSMWNPSKLAQTKQKVKAGSAEFQKPIHKLMTEANSYLDFQPVSVTQGTQIPPSGDKHDYWSIGTYWWPCYWNESNIPKDCNTTTGVPWVNRDGEFSPYRDPAGDKTKFGEMITAVSSLTIAYYFSDNEAYASKAAELIKYWFLNEATKMNPNLNYAQQHPGVNNGSKEGIIDFRLIADPDSAESIGGLLNGVALLQGSPAWTANDEKALQNWFKEYQKWLLTSKLGVEEGNTTNNHAVWYDVQVGSIAFYVSDFATLDSLLKAEGPKHVAKQVAPDGSLPEELTRTNSFHYSWFCLAAFLDVADIGLSRNIDVWKYSTSDHRSIKQAIDFLVPYAVDGKPWPYQQISPFDGDFYNVFRRASIAFNETYYESLNSKLPDHSDSLINLLWPKIF